MTVLIYYCKIANSRRSPQGTSAISLEGLRKAFNVGTESYFLLSWVIEGWWHRFRSVVYGCLFRELRQPHWWQKCKQTAKNKTFYRFRWHHPLVTQLSLNGYYKIPRFSSNNIWNTLNLGNGYKISKHQKSSFMPLWQEWTEKVL